jgi:predicted membrane channel-forming protein YqfA (hemolysin III family)
VRYRQPGAGPWAFPPPQVRALTLLACGLLTFIAAMAFDLSDRERLTRRADCAFWLHLLAAPLIVHSLITLVAPDYFIMMTTSVAVTILAIFAALTIVAIVIDRRALLVSALAYVGIAVAYGLRTTSVIGQQADSQAVVLFTTLLVLGSLVLALGVGWLPLRRRLTRMLPSALTERLPPAVAA